MLYASGFLGFQSSQTPLSKKTANLLLCCTGRHDTRRLPSTPASQPRPHILKHTRPKQPKPPQQTNGVASYQVVHPSTAECYMLQFAHGEPKV